MVDFLAILAWWAVGSREYRERLQLQENGRPGKAAVVNVTASEKRLQQGETETRK